MFRSKSSPVKGMVASDYKRDSLSENLLQVLQPLDRDLVAGGLHATPNGGSAGNHLHVGRERFDHDVALVADALQCFDDRLPVQAVVARRSAIRPTGMEVPEQFANL